MKEKKKFFSLDEENFPKAHFLKLGILLEQGLFLLSFKLLFHKQVLCFIL